MELPFNHPPKPLLAFKDALLVQHEDPSRRAQAENENENENENEKPQYYSASTDTLCINFPPAFFHPLSSQHPATNRAEAHSTICPAGALPHSESSCPRSAKPWVFGASQPIQPIVDPTIPRYFRIECCAQYCNPTFQKESL